MSVKIEYKGKDVDAAIKLACEKLNVSRDDLYIEIVSHGSAGIFGLFRKKAKILVSKKETGRPSVAEDAPSISSTSSKDSAPKAKKSPKESYQKTDNVPGPPPSIETLDEIRDTITSILELMGHPSTVTVNCDGNRTLGHISGSNEKNIIGRDGCIIDAIQYLIRKIISQKFPEKIYFSLDAGNYRELRKQELEILAQEMAAQVKETGRNRTTSALNPAERRIIHVMLQDDKTIRSVSVGEGMFKKIKVYLPGTGRKKQNRRPRSGHPRNSHNRKPKKQTIAQESSSD